MAASKSDSSDDRHYRTNSIWNVSGVFTRPLAALAGWMAIGDCGDPPRQPVCRQTRTGRLRDWPGHLGLPSVYDDFWGNVYKSKESEAKLLATALGQAYSSATLQRLIDHAGNLPRVLLSDKKELVRLTGDRVLASQLIAIKDIAVAFLRSDTPPPELADSHTLLRYLRSVMGKLRIETCRVIFLDSYNRVLSDEVMWSGTTKEVHVHTREVMRRAIAVDASALIVAHNHPSGVIYPSDTDIALTRELLIAARSLEIILHDHLIVTANDVASIRLGRWIDPWM
jgi:DNA repair protein RadC